MISCESTLDKAASIGNIGNVSTLRFRDVYDAALRCQPVMKTDTGNGGVWSPQILGTTYYVILGDYITIDTSSLAPDFSLLSASSLWEPVVNTGTVSGPWFPPQSEPFPMGSYTAKAAANCTLWLSRETRGHNYHRWPWRWRWESMKPLYMTCNVPYLPLLDGGDVVLHWWDANGCGLGFPCFARRSVSSSYAVRTETTAGKSHQWSELATISETWTLSPVVGLTEDEADEWAAIGNSPWLYITDMNGHSRRRVFPASRLSYRTRNGQLLPTIDIVT